MEIENQEKQGEEQKKEEKAGCFGIGISFLIPLVGVILYFVKKKEVANAAAYLYAALAGFGVGIVFQLLKTANS
jgi:predicted membrane channel-forming protein YqfA (hemolysin III family)